MTATFSLLVRRRSFRSVIWETIFVVLVILNRGSYTCVYISSIFFAFHNVRHTIFSCRVVTMIFEEVIKWIR